MPPVTRRNTKQKLGEDGVEISTPPRKSASSPSKKTADDYQVELKSRGAAESKLHKFMTRIIAGSVLFGGLLTVLYLGHVYCVGLVLVIQVMLFRELTNVRYNEAKEMKIPLFRSLMWAVFVNAMFYAYGDVIYRFELFAPYKHYHAWITFSLYVMIFITYVLSLKAELYKYQMGQLTWTGLSVALVVLQSRYITSNIFQGLFWFILPAFLVICNDSCAYFVGMPLKQKIIDQPFLSLSPNKSWEGFIGGGVCTIIAGFMLPVFLRNDWLICPMPVGSAWVDHLTCKVNPVFEYEVWQVPALVTTVTGSTTMNFMPIQFHAVLLSLFASLVAPFGGFFASAIKRAYSIKDFASLIPGHGGLMDRMDCQLIMGMCTAVHYNAFISISSITAGYILTLLSQLPVEEQAVVHQRLSVMMAK